MNELQRKHGGEGFVVVAVNLDQDRALADAFLGKTPATFRVEFDPAGTSPASSTFRPCRPAS